MNHLNDVRKPKKLKHSSLAFILKVNNDMALLRFIKSYKNKVVTSVLSVFSDIYMSSLGIKSIATKKYRPHSSKNICLDRPNILNREFSPSRINEKWCTDITYIHTTKDGWTYLASVMDLYSKKIIGYAYGTSMTAELAIDAVKNACLNTQNTEGIMLHSDLGSQYTSEKFTSYLTSKKMVQSFSRKSNPYDNACIESFHSILKKEEINHHKYYDFKEASRVIFEYIESWYNRSRIHSALDYKTPHDVHELARTA